MNLKLEALFYLLIRDHLPAGELIKIVKDVQDLEHGTQFTNPHILSLAKDLLGRLNEK